MVECLSLSLHSGLGMGLVEIVRVVLALTMTVSQLAVDSLMIFPLEII